MKYKLLYQLILVFSLTSCTTVKPAERIYLNDTEMQLGNTAKNYENYVYSIREASIATGEINQVVAVVVIKTIE